MKRSLIIFLVAAMVLATTALWFFTSTPKLNFMDNLHFFIIILIVGFAVFVGYKRLTNARRGEPTEDELSKKVLQKTAAWSYYISLYLWVGVIFINDRVEIDTEVLIGSGILAMALVFAICWLVFNFRGIRNE